MRRTTLLLLLALLGTVGCLRSTGTTEVGVLVRKIALFGKSGVQDTIYDPGSTYFVMPIINDWYTFDTKTQNLEMVADPKRGDRLAQDDLRFKTIDGNDISLDVIVTYRIIKKMVPFIVQNVARSDEELKNSVVRTVARSRSRDLFGELKTEEFYNAAERDKKSELVAQKLNEILNNYGVNVERVLTKDYRFNPEYQKAIEDKKVADQRAEKFKSETHAATEEYQRKVEQTQGEVNQMTAQADGEYKRTVLEVDAYFEQQAKRAEAIRAEAEADAKGITEMNKALLGQGGEVMVKMRLAEALAGKKILLLPNGGGGVDLKTTNINQLLQLYGAKKLADDSAVKAGPQ